MDVQFTKKAMEIYRNIVIKNINAMAAFGHNDILKTVLMPDMLNLFNNNESDIIKNMPDAIKNSVEKINKELCLSNEYDYNYIKQQVNLSFNI